MLKFECLSIESNELVNEKINRLKKLEEEGMITEKEKQFMFITSLLKFLSHNETFEVYTNTDL